MNSNPQMDERKEEADWLRSLRDQAQSWVKKNGGLSTTVERKELPVPTSAYVDLIFAFGLARLGAHAESHELVERARIALREGDEAHGFLFKAYLFRISQAWEGQLHSGSLSIALMEQLEHLYFGLIYVVDRLRKHSRILEPDQKVNPYRQWANRISPLHGALNELTKIADGYEIESRVRQLLSEPPPGTLRDDPRRCILEVALKMVPRVDAAFAREILTQAQTTYDVLPASRKQYEHEDGAEFLCHALFAVAYFGFTEQMQPWLNRLREIVQPSHPSAASLAMARLAERCVRSLHHAKGKCDEIERLLTLLGDLVLTGTSLEALAQNINFKEDPAHFVILLHRAESQCRQGDYHQAQPLLEAVWAILGAARFPRLHQTTLLCAFAQTVGRLPTVEARRRFEAIFRDLPAIRDGYSTWDHFNLPMLEVIETVVLATVERPYC